MIENKVAIVTGAGSGIGRAVAVQLATTHAFAVVLVGRTNDKLERTRDVIINSGGGASFVHVLTGDITQPKFCRQIINDTITRWDRIDAIANVAGAAPLQPIEQTNDDTWRNVIDTNLTSIVHLTTAAWPHMKEQADIGGSVIANVSSLASFDPFPGFALYASAKVGVNMFTMCTAREGDEHNIRAVAVAPGAVETPMLRGLFDESIIAKEQTLSPDDVAAVLAGCITGQREFESGETIQLSSPS